MRKAILFFIFLYILIGSYGNGIDTTTAKQVAFNYLSSKAAISIQKNAPDFNLVYQAISRQKAGEVQSLFYVFNVGSTGFIIVSADDRVKPVLAYSSESTFDTSTQSPATKAWLSSYQKEIEYVINHNIAAPPSISQQWQTLRSGNIIQQKVKKSVNTPMILTKWGQGNRYNSLCPYDATQQAYCVTGCVVVAMSQVMNYWQHPVNGLGYHSYVDNPYGVLSANFENTTYLYDSMPISLSYKSSANQIRAIATLMFHCGVAIDIQYGVYGSDATLAEYTAGSPSGELALKTYFGYPDIIGLDRSHYSDSAWIAIIKNEIDSGRPVIYRATGDVGGHAFIFDAYNDTDYFHINWGWTGYADGYFSVSALNPMSYSFPNGHYCLINIKPTPYTIHPDSNHIVYISPSGSGKKDGSSWDNASPYLSFAVKRHYAHPTQLWVQAGIYYGDTNLETAFQLAAGNKVYGGFIGNEPANFDLNLRNFTLNSSIIDGQNKQRVLATAGATDTNRSLCDGFIIQNGYTTTGGAGVYMNGGELNNCIIRNNINDSSYGGGLYVKSKAFISNCLIHSNKGTFGGGAIIWDSTYFYNCTFANNLATSNGGALYNCDTCFAVNCILWGNKRNTYNNQLSSNSGTYTEISFSAIQGNYSGTNNINLSAYNDDVDTFSYVRFVNPSLNDYNLQSSSCCVDAGDRTIKNIKTTDLAGLRRIKNGKIDMGAYEYGCYVNYIYFDTSCFGSMYTNHGFTYFLTTKGNLTFVKKLISASDCDSIITLNLFVVKPDTTLLEDGICFGKPYQQYGFDTLPNRDGVLYLQQKLTNQNGWDSIVLLTLYVTTIDSTIIEDNICLGDTYAKNGFTIQTDSLTTGSYNFSLLTSNMYGCDSLAILHLYISKSDSSYIYDSICHGKNYTKNGFKINTGVFQIGTINRKRTSLNQYGCDSIIHLFLTILPTSDSIIHDAVKKGDIYNKNGFIIHTDTLALDTINAQQLLINQYGCDSIVYLQLNVNVGFNNINSDIEITVYPNPATNYLEIKVQSTNLSNYETMLCDLTGKTLKHIVINNEITRMDISNIAVGFYFLKIQDGIQNLRTIKIIKQ